MTSATIQLRVDSTLRDDAQLVCNRLGMDLTTAIRVFLNQLVADNGLPFRPVTDPFYSPANMRHLKRLHDDYLAAKNIVPHDLIEDDRK